MDICAISVLEWLKMQKDNKIKTNQEINASSNKNLKQKTLLPTLKEAQRYLVYEVLSNAEIKENEFKYIHDSIINKCNVLLGIFESAKAGLMSAKFEGKTKKGIIKLNRKYVDKMKICLGMIKEIDGKKISINTIYVSGMLHNATDKMNTD